MMKKLFAVSAIEEMDDVDILNEGEEVEPLTDDEVEEMRLMFADINDEIQMFFDDDEDNRKREEQGNVAIENLENIANIIEKYGISAPMMMIADPHRELIASGVFTIAYEDLSDVPVIGEESLAAIEGISDVIAGLKQKLISVSKRIGKMFYELNVSSTKFESNFMNVLTTVGKNAANVKDIHEDKFLARNIRAYDKKTFMNLSRSIDAVTNTLKQGLVSSMFHEVERFFSESDIDRGKSRVAADKIGKILLSLDVKTIERDFGILIDQGNDGHIHYVNNSHEIKKDAYAPVSTHGYTANDVIPIIRQALKLKGTTNKLKLFSKYVYDLSNTNTKLDSYFKVNEERKAKDLAELEIIWNQYTKAIRAIFMITVALWKAIQHYCSSAAQLGIAYYKSRVK